MQEKTKQAFVSIKMQKEQGTIESTRQRDEFS